MKVGVLGTGPVGQALGRGFILTGHDVMMGSRKAGGEAAKTWVKEMGPKASEGTFADAARFGDLVVFAVDGTALAEVAAAAGEGALAGKVIIDPSNPLDTSHGFPPGLAIAGNDSGGETLQRLVPEARVVKAFNTTNNSLFYKPDLPGGPPDMFIAGDDAEAKRVVGGIVRDFGWNLVDLGPIKSSRWLEAMCIAWVMACAPDRNWQKAFKLLS